MNSLSQSEKLIPHGDATERSIVVIANMPHHHAHVQDFFGGGRGSKIISLVQPLTILIFHLRGGGGGGISVRGG